MIVDPSHAAGRDLVVPLSKAAVAAEADGLMVESHHEPQEALCDGEQALPVETLMGMKDVLQPSPVPWAGRLSSLGHGPGRILWVASGTGSCSCASSAQAGSPVSSSGGTGYSAVRSPSGS